MNNKKVYNKCLDYDSFQLSLELDSFIFQIVYYSGDILCLFRFKDR